MSSYIDYRRKSQKVPLDDAEYRLNIYGSLVDGKPCISFNQDFSKIIDAKVEKLFAMLSMEFPSEDLVECTEAFLKAGFKRFPPNKNQNRKAELYPLGPCWNEMRKYTTGLPGSIGSWVCPDVNDKVDSLIYSNKKLGPATIVKDNARACVSPCTSTESDDDLTQASVITTSVVCVTPTPTTLPKWLQKYLDMISKDEPPRNVGIGPATLRAFKRIETETPIDKSSWENARADIITKGQKYNRDVKNLKGGKSNIFYNKVVKYLMDK